MSVAVASSVDGTDVKAFQEAHMAHLVWFFAGTSVGIVIASLLTFVGRMEDQLVEQQARADFQTLQAASLNLLRR